MHHLVALAMVSNPVAIAEDVAVEGIWMHEAWPNMDARATTKIGLLACELGLCVLKGLQSDLSGMSKPWNRLRPLHRSHLCRWLNRA